MDVYSFLQNNSYSSSSTSNQNDASIAEIVERSGVHNAQGQGILRGVHAAKVCCVLSSKADELFHTAALRLSLPSLCGFLTELCKASHVQVSKPFCTRYCMLNCHSLNWNFQVSIVLSSSDCERSTME